MHHHPSCEFEADGACKQLDQQPKHRTATSDMTLGGVSTAETVRAGSRRLA